MAVNDHALGPLPCGVVLEDLITQVTEGESPLDRAHQTACEFCQAALEVLRRAWEDLQELARTAVAIPDDLGERVMQRVRELSTGSSGGVVVTRARGHTRVASEVIHRVARIAAGTVPGVVWASVTDVVSEEPARGELDLAVRLVVELGPSLPELGERVRGQVTEALRLQAGATVGRIDVLIEDLGDPAGESTELF